MTHTVRVWAGFALAMLFAAPVWAPACAEDVTVLETQVPTLGRYDARAIVTGTDMRDRPKGMAQCLADVLVKVSGDTSLASDPSVAALGAQAATLIANFDYWDRMSAYAHHDDQGSYDRPFDLTAHFDPARIGAVLQQLGRTPWPDPRPVLVAIVHAQGRGTEFDITRDEPLAEDMRDALFDTEQKYGVTFAVPSNADRATWRKSGYAAAPGQVPLAGSLVLNAAAQGWVATWHLDWQGRGYDWGVSGVNFDEAFRVAARGAMSVLSGHGAPRG